MSDAFTQALGALAADGGLWRDFNALCDCGGRMAGGDSERRGIDTAHAALKAIARGTLSLEPVRYAGWRLDHARLTHVPGGTELACTALVGAQSTPPPGVEAEIIDLGRGTPEQFEQRGAEIAGRIVLVSHEYPFMAGHIHRRRKYNAAMERGAAGFIIANPVAGTGTTCGSSGRGGQAGIPAVATDWESAARLRGMTRPRVRIDIAGDDFEASTQVVILDLPGATDERVVLSAHIDGHHLAESAMDNATGVAGVIAIARAFAPSITGCRRGLRVCLFSAEEWALAGSKEYLARMAPAEVKRLVLNVNLDTIAGGSRLTALTSEFPALDGFVQGAAADIGMPLETYRPMMSNSDHYNFALHGIPALRLVAGFDDPASNVRHILTPADTRDKVAAGELKASALLAAAITWRGLNATDAEVAALKGGK
jgi:aminopeptidase YwaD